MLLRGLGPLWCCFGLLGWCRRVCCCCLCLPCAFRWCGGVLSACGPSFVAPYACWFCPLLLLLALLLLPLPLALVSWVVFVSPFLVAFLLVFCCFEIFGFPRDFRPECECAFALHHGLKRFSPVYRAFHPRSKTFSLVGEPPTALRAWLHSDDVGLVKKEPDKVAVAEVLAAWEAAQERTKTQRTKHAEASSVGLPATIPGGAFTTMRRAWEESPAANPSHNKRSRRQSSLQSQSWSSGTPR